VKELCESHVGTMSVEGEDSEPEPKLCWTLPKRKKRSWKSNHSSTHTATAMVIMSVLSLESSFFKLRHKVSTKQLPIRVFFHMN
jgi:hypothetical protein